MGQPIDLSTQLSKLRLAGDTFNTKYFASESYSTAGLIAKTAEPVIANSDHLRPDDVDQLLQAFKKLDARFAELSEGVAASCASQRQKVSADAAAYVARIDATERDVAALQEALQSLDARADALSSFASRIGSRLGAADQHRTRARSAAEALAHLHAFAHSRDLSSLPQIYQDEGRMEQAATLAVRLQTAVTAILQAREVASSAGVSRSRGPPEPGTLAAAGEQLELYRNILDNRVVSRFDAALREQDFPAMAGCARIMAATGANGPNLLLSRYVSTRQLFSDVAALQAAAAKVGKAASSSQPSSREAGRQPPPGAGVAQETPTDGQQQVQDPLSAVRSLSDLYCVLSGSLREEAVVLEQVFPDAQKATAALVQRVFEQVVQSALEAALSPPPSLTVDPDTLRTYLRLLTEAYRKTLSLADEAVELAGPGSGLQALELADTGCGEALERYLDLELAWLKGLGGAKLGSTKRTLSRDLLLDLISMNEEAVRRCVQVSQPGQRAAAVRLLFHAKTEAPSQGRGAATVPACLLGQAAAHMLLGLKGAEDRCVRHLAGAFRPAPAADKAQAAHADAAASLGILLRAIADVAGMATLLREHYDRVVLPHVAAVPAEAAACAEGLAQLVSAIDDRVGAALERTLTQFFRRLAATLAAEQTKADFRPVVLDSGSHAGGDASFEAPALDRPTDACVSGVALLNAMGAQAAAHLHGSNLAAFLGELARRTAAVIETHALRYTFSSEGALRWRRDVAEFATCLAGLEARGAPLFEDLHSLASLLIVGPDSLPGLVDGLVHIDRQRVQRIVERREDYKTAKIGDRPLTLPFA